MSETEIGRNRHVSIDDAWDYYEYDNEHVCTDLQTQRLKDIKRDLLNETERISDSLKRDAVKIAKHQPSRILELVRMGVLFRPEVIIDDEEKPSHILNVENIMLDHRELTYWEIRALDELLNTDVSTVERIESMEFIQQFITRRIRELKEQKYQEDLVSNY